jgi:hypothetical protein
VFGIDARALALDGWSSASHTSSMEAPVSRLPFWLHELIAQAKRRARQRRLFVVLLLVVVAGVTAAVVLHPSGGGSRSGSLSGRVGGTSASTRSVHFGAFVLTVPKGFHQLETRQSSIPNAALHSIAVADDSRTAKAVSYGQLSPANGVVLYAESFGSAPPGSAPRLPLDLHKLQRVPDAPLGDGTGTQWSAFLSGGGGAYAVTVFEGSKASAADRSAIERALRSIRHAS